MKYWSRVSGNRWLVAKMFGVLMVVLAVNHCRALMLTRSRFSSFYGSSWPDKTLHWPFIACNTAFACGMDDPLAA